MLHCALLNIFYTTRKVISIWKHWIFSNCFSWQSKYILQQKHTLNRKASLSWRWRFSAGPEIQTLPPLGHPVSDFYDWFILMHPLSILDGIIKGCYFSVVGEMTLLIHWKGGFLQRGVWMKMSLAVHWLLLILLLKRNKYYLYRRKEIYKSIYLLTLFVASRSAWIIGNQCCQVVTENI